MLPREEELKAQQAMQLMQEGITRRPPLLEDACSCRIRTGRLACCWQKRLLR
ncbi:hypothetical protein ACNKHM_04465 [Shigella sonnei]